MSDRDDEEKSIIKSSQALPVIPEFPEEYYERAKELERGGYAKNTIRTYKALWKRFALWCHDVGATCLPASPEVVVMFVVAVDGDLAPGSMNAVMSAIKYAHDAAGFPNPASHPTVKKVVKGYGRNHGKDTRRALPLMVDQLLQMLGALTGESGIVQRDRALLLTGFALALRRSELCAMNVDDVRFDEGGTAVVRVGGGLDDEGKMRTTKTDQEGKGVYLRLEAGQNPSTCPVRVLRKWVTTLHDAGINAGPLFPPLTKSSCLREGRLSGEAISKIIRAAMKKAGLNSTGYSGHSLRAGFVTSMRKLGKRYEDIVPVTRHRNLDTVRIYDRDPETPASDVLKDMGF